MARLSVGGPFSTWGDTEVFGVVQVRGARYDWSQRYTTAEWLDHLPTHSDHRLLEPELVRGWCGERRHSTPIA